MCRFDSNSKGTCANFLLTGKVQFVGQEGVWYNHFLSQIMQIISLGWPFTKETVKNFISCVPSAQGQSLPNCMYWVQSTLWLPGLYFGKDPLLFFVALVKVQLVVCVYCYHPYVCLACISETSLCFLSSRTKAQFVVCTHCNQHQDRLAECQSSISSPWITQHIAKNTTEHTEPHCKEHTEPHCKEHTEPHCKEHIRKQNATEHKERLYRLQHHPGVTVQ